jgi:tRNA U34 5-carboxymethylaminomethyl modifying GTPase MnmE/TrmE
MDIQAAMDALDQITGETVKADVLDSVFSMFCIGK